MEIKSIAVMIIEQLISREMIVDRIKSHWQPAKTLKTLEDVISEVRDEYSRNISTELAYDQKRKLQAVEVSLTAMLTKK